MLLGHGERQSFRPQRVRRLRAPRPRAARAVRRRAAARPTRLPVRPLRDLRLQAALRRVVGRDDSLCRVAGVGRREMEKLEPAGITTLAGLAHATEPAGLNAERFAKLRRQAALQLERRETGEPVYELLPPHADAGFALLPDPSPGDLFFDIEGNPFWDEQGSLEYLWGVTRRGRRLHAALGPRPRERAARVRGVRRPRPRAPAEHPEMHVYHYAGYEVTALRRLMGRYGTREAEVDDLLRRGVLVDLLKVVRGGLAASVPGYGLKEMEVVPRLRRHGRDPGRRHLDRRVRALHPDARPGDPRRDRRLQPGGLRRDPPAARLAARAAGGGARAVRPDPAARAGRAEGAAAGEGGARRAARGAARRGRGARRPAPRLPRPRAQAGLVGVLRPARDDPGRARRGRRVDRRARPDRRAGAGRAVGRPRVRVPAAGAQAARSPPAVRPGGPQARARSSRSTARSACSSSSAGRGSTRCRCRRR